MAKGHKGNVGDADYVLILTVVMVSGEYMYVKTHPIVAYNMCVLLYVSYTSIKLFRKSHSPQPTDVPSWEVRGGIYRHKSRSNRP